ncbi:MAG: amino acid racemase [bacterium]
MTQHIGIVACSAEGAALCYRTICMEGPGLLGEYSHPEITMHTPPFQEYMRCFEVDDWDGVADLMVLSAEKVAKVGADFAICPDNTIHQVFDQVVDRSPIPWLHIAEEVAIEAVRKGYRKVGVLGTRFLMEGPVYTSRLGSAGVERIIPQAADRERVDRIIFTELVSGRFTDEARATFGEVIDRFKNEGCDAVVLGCTEIPLLITEKDSSLPTLDSTRILARAALKRAAGSQSA